MRIQHIIIVIGIAASLIVIIISAFMIQSNTQHVVIVSGYGAPVIGNPGYQNYIAMIKEFVNNPDNEVDAVVFNGGYTSLQDESEAELMVAYYNSLEAPEKAVQPQVYEQRCSVIAWQSIANSKEVLAENGLVLRDIGKVTMIGDIKSERAFTLWADYQFNELEKNTAEIAFVGFDHNSPEKPEMTDEEILSVYTDEAAGKESVRERVALLTELFGFDVAANMTEKGCDDYSGFPSTSKDGS